MTTIAAHADACIESGVNGSCRHDATETKVAATATDLHNFRVDYVAPARPEHSFEPRCAIIADSVEYGKKLRVFDVPDPDEEQRALAQKACDSLNNIDSLREREAKLTAAIKELFKQCVMMHKEWGDGCNQKEANAAEAAILALIDEGETR